MLSHKAALHLVPYTIAPKAFMSTLECYPVCYNVGRVYTWLRCGWWMFFRDVIS